MSKVITIPKPQIISLAVFGALTLIAFFAPFIKQQAITGTIVNAALFLGAYFFGPSAIMIGLIPSLISLSVGLLPPVLAPAVPFIMTGNAVLIMTFLALRNRNFWLGAIIASIFKFAFLFSSSFLVAKLILKPEIAEKAALMLGLPQLFTALAGSILAFLILKVYRGLSSAK